MFVAVCCDRGAPGATTTALALGAAWPGDAIVVEADPYGGDLALRCRAPGGGVWPETPTVLTVATAARTSSSPDLVSSYAHRFTDHVGVVPAHLAAEQAAGVMDWTPLARALLASSVDVIADLGRIHAHSPSLPIAAAANVVVVVCRADLGAVVHLTERLTRLIPAIVGLRGRPPTVFPLVIAPRRVGAEHAAQLWHLLADTLAGPVIAGAGWLAWDPVSVERLEQGEAGRARSPLNRAADAVAAQLLTLAPQRTDAGASPSPVEAS